jgi:hypothetical protein
MNSVRLWHMTLTSSIMIMIPEVFSGHIQEEDLADSIQERHITDSIADEHLNNRVQKSSHMKIELHRLPRKLIVEAE